MRPQPAPESSTQPNPPISKRREPRHPVDIGAKLYLVDLCAQMPGRLLDISLGGCRLRTNDCFLLGIYHRVEAEFRVDGMPFRLAGVTQAVYDRHTLGIRFLNMSERKREQLAQLMKDIRAEQDLDQDPDELNPAAPPLTSN